MIWIRHTYARSKWFCNPISGHEWSETGRHIGYEVLGTGWLPTFYKTLEKAQAAKVELEEIDRKFPFKMPVSKREVASCKRLGIKIDWNTHVPMKEELR